MTNPITSKLKDIAGGHADRRFRFSRVPATLVSGARRLFRGDHLRLRQIRLLAPMRSIGTATVMPAKNGNQILTLIVFLQNNVVQFAK
ncbi:MAG TPA: hypothetical protein VFX30_00735 [bacterium]|nr:hypothetical protein [bacterium]